MSDAQLPGVHVGKPPCRFAMLRAMISLSRIRVLLIMSLPFSQGVIAKAQQLEGAHPKVLILTVTASRFKR